MEFRDVTRTLAADCGLPALVPDANGAVAVAFGELVVNLRPGTNSEVFHLEARLGALTHPASERVIALMEDNRWPRESRTGVLAVDASGAVFLFHHVVGRSLSPERLRSLLRRFARQSEQWRQRLSNEVVPAAPVALPCSTALIELA